jgi:hypothetical protein
MTHEGDRKIENTVNIIDENDDQVSTITLVKPIIPGVIDVQVLKLLTSFNEI